MNETPHKCGNRDTNDRLKSKKSTRADDKPRGKSLEGGSALKTSGEETSTGLKCHKKTHSGEKVHKCPECPYSASDARYLKIHRRTHSQEKPFQCQQCPYASARLAAVKTHERMHTGERSFPCDQCKSTFKTQSHLKRHLRTHSQEKKTMKRHVIYT